MKRTSQAATGSACSLLRYGDTDVWVLPSRHWSIEFALPALQVDLRRFDRICLELPASLDVAVVRRALAQLQGCPGAILLPRRGPFDIRIPESEEDDTPDRRSLFFSTMLPVVHDSMVSTLRALEKLGPGAPVVEFVDADEAWAAPVEARERDVLPPMDPQEVTARGLEAWFRRLEPWINGLKPPAEDLAREAAMAARLRAGALRDGGRTLFICGAAHWPRIRERLDSGADLAVPVPSAAPVEQGPRVVALDAATLYSWGFLDVPYLAGRFERSFCRGRPAFNRDAEVRRLVGAAHTDARAAVHPRALVLMGRYLKRLVASDARWSADLDRHILPAAEAAVGRPFRDVLERAAMRYPVGPPDDVDEGRVVPVGGTGWGIMTPSEVHLVRIGDSGPVPDASGRPLRRSVPTRLSTRERERLDRSTGIHMKPGPEELLHKFMCDHARREAHLLVPRGRRFIPAPFRGRLHAGVEAKRTMCACARGRPELFVRRRLRTRPLPCDCDLCPVVWVFDAGAPVRHKLGDWFPDGDGRRLLYASFFWFLSRERNGPAWSNRIAYFVRLFRNITPSWDRSLVLSKLLGWMPDDRRCHVEPWCDPVLADRFQGPDLAVACAVRWTMTDHVTVVRADPTWEVGIGSRAFAAEAGVELLEPAAGVFDPILLDRYQRDNEIPTRSSWTPPDPVFLRYVEPVPGFPGDERASQPV